MYNCELNSTKEPKKRKNIDVLNVTLDNAVFPASKFTFFSPF